MWDLCRTEAFAKVSQTDGDRVQSESSAADSRAGSVAGASGGAGSLGEGLKISEAKRDILGNPHSVVKPHHFSDIPKVKTTIRHIAFSQGGEYMVMVGEGSMISICKRWGG